MNTSPPPPPSGPHLPARRPFGSITLPAGPLPLPCPATAPRAALGHWHPDRVRLPLLSIAALRSGHRDG
ncbi:hypothetical protein OG552_07565 [Streptomyces sp. NBC_01476]|uniref:hypothetical protein n=1 Tax=Streptomyces sp. NBC_01476 TaxID=2903881 RepID=UPI002E36C1CD|nr:hypothetical protein [Streptomyces sp. NBC_01476]